MDGGRRLSGNQVEAGALRGLVLGHVGEPDPWTWSLAQSLASDRLVTLDLTGLDEAHARVERPGRPVLRVIAECRLLAPVGRSPVEQLSDDRAPVTLALVPSV